MKSIFACDDESKIYEVYSANIVQYLADIAGLVEKCFNMDKILNFDLSDVEYIFSTWNMPKLTEEEIRQHLPALKAVFYAAGTVKYFAEPFMKCGVRIFSARNANSIPVAEYTASQIILANKGYFQAQCAMKNYFYTFGFRKGKSIASSKAGNFGTKVGLIGAGSVAQKVIALLKNYHIDVAVYDPYISGDIIKELGVQSMELPELFENCDVISNHLPDSKETRGIINYSLLSKMKHAATFINTGRGRQVVEKDLAKVMHQKPFACALLDVTCHEPCLPFNPLLHRKNVFISPHLAGSQSNEMLRMGNDMATAFKDLTCGKANANEITAEILKNMA